MTLVGCNNGGDSSGAKIYSFEKMNGAYSGGYLQANGYQVGMLVGTAPIVSDHEKTYQRMFRIYGGNQDCSYEFTKQYQTNPSDGSVILGDFLLMWGSTTEAHAYRTGDFNYTWDDNCVPFLEDAYNSTIRYDQDNNRILIQFPGSDVVNELPYKPIDES